MGRVSATRAAMFETRAVPLKLTDRSVKYIALFSSPVKHLHPHRRKPWNSRTANSISVKADSSSGQAFTGTRMQQRRGVRRVHAQAHRLETHDNEDA